ncbi:hypothetical protein ACHAWO_004262 [Cyclotella atomus]|uniref:Uncharacterized protein n=1 Tax=Cyclotella atomus TaxID=382360 RepID=A0ABD3Q6L5_9STRA
MTVPSSRKKPGKINKFLQAYMNAASNEEPQKQNAEAKPIRKWKPVTPKPEATAPELKAADAPAALPAGDETKVDEVVAVAVTTSSVNSDEAAPPATLLDTSNEDDLNTSNENDKLETEDALKPKEIATNVDAQETNKKIEEIANGQEPIQEPLTKEEKLAHREANYKRLLQSTSVQGEKFEHMFSVMSRASQLCATPQTPNSQEQERVTNVGGLGIDLLESVDGEDARGAIMIGDEVDFDAGSVTDNEEEDIQVVDDTLESPFDDLEESKEKVEEPPLETESELAKNKMDISTDTISTADITQENNETSSPEPNSAGPKSRFSRSFSKAKLRFDKRKHVGKTNSDSPDSKSSRDTVKEVIDATGVTENKMNETLMAGEDDPSEFNPDTIAATEGNKFNFYVTPATEEFCSGSYQGGSVDGSVADGSKFSFYSAAYDERRSEATSSGTDSSAYAHTGISDKFSFYSSTSIIVNNEEKKEANSFDEGSKKAADDRRFSFYSSTPLDDTSIRDDNASDEGMRNNSLLAEETKLPTALKDGADHLRLYTSMPMNMESFDGSDAIAGTDSSTHTANEENDLHGTQQPERGIDVDQVLNEDEVSYESYTMSLKGGCDDHPKAIDGSFRSFVSFREKKIPGSRNVKPADSCTELVQTETVDSLETENISPTNVIETLHAKTLDASNSSPLMKKYQLGRSLDATASFLANNQASTKLFTKEEIDDITPLQIATYLHLDERKSIGTRVLSEKMMRGYTIAVSSGAAGKADSTVCSTCDMPMLCKNGKNLESCVICPTLKKKVLKRILHPMSSKSSNRSVDSPQDAAVSDARKELLDVSKRKSYYERSQQQQNNDTNQEWYTEGRNAVQYAKDVLADRIVDVKVEGNETMSPRILFPDDDSVEVTVMKHDTNEPQTQSVTVPPPPTSVKAPPSPIGRPPLAPQPPASVKLSPSQKSVKSVSSRQPNEQIDMNVVASSAGVAIQQQIEDTKSKLLSAQDPRRQILYSNLLTKLNGALIAVQRLEDISKQ